MLTAVRGLYRQGQIQLLEPVMQPEICEVIVTFLPRSPSSKTVSLRERGIMPDQAAELRQRLATFAADWDAPGMEAYDDL